MKKRKLNLKRITLSLAIIVISMLLISGIFTRGAKVTVREYMLAKSKGDYNKVIDLMDFVGVNTYQEWYIQNDVNIEQLYKENLKKYKYDKEYKSQLEEQKQEMKELLQNIHNNIEMLKILKVQKNGHFVEVEFRCLNKNSRRRNRFNSSNYKKRT